MADPTKTPHMNPVVELLNGHRSIRRFRPDPVPREHLEAAVRAGQMASTSSAVQAYCALNITDPAVRRQFVALTGGQAKVEACGAFLVICGDVRRHRLVAARAGMPYASNLEAFLVSVIDATLFAQNLCVALESMGYGICYIGGVRNDLPAVDRLLEIPDGIYPLFGLCIGLPDESPEPRPRLPVSSILFDDRCPDDSDTLAALADYDAIYASYLESRSGESRSGRSRGWTEAMGRKFSTAEREGLAAYYERKGAVLGTVGR